MEAAGFRIIRYDMLWEQVERTKGTYDFSTFDRLVAQMMRRGIRPLFILDYGNRLYGDHYSARTPDSRGAFARFAAAAAARYKGKGVMWEIWNEPNAARFWTPQPDPFEYLLLVIESASAIRAEDPGAYIIGGSVSGVDFAFLERCIKYGLLKYVDAVSVHPYRDQQPESVLGEYEKLRALMHTYLPAGKTIAFAAGEWGYHSASGRSEEEQARKLARMMMVNAYAGSGMSIWYDFRNDGQDPKDAEHNFGLFRYDGKEKPAAIAMQRMTQHLSRKRFTRRLTSRPDDYLLEFADENGKACVAAWTTGKDHAVTVNGAVAVTVTQTPQYLGCDDQLRSKP